MSDRRTWVVEVITQLVKDAPTSAAAATAELIVERLTEEGLLHLGYGDADIDIIVEGFSQTFGTTKTSKQDRWAARRLADKYGSQSVRGIVRLLAEHSTEKYAPVVNTIVQLEEKMPSVLNFLRKLSGDEEINV